MKHLAHWGGRILLLLGLLLLAGCGATRVELPLDMPDQLLAHGYQMPQYQADLLLAMNDDDATLRYMAAIHDLKLQLDIGPAYKQNLLGVMDMMFATTRHVKEVAELRKGPSSNQTYALEASFQLVRVTIPRTRFGKTQAHIIIRYTFFDPRGKKLFTFTDYAFGGQSNALLIPPGMSLFVGEGGLARNAMERNMVTSISQVVGLIQQYMDGKTRDEMLAQVATHEQGLADGAAAYTARLQNGDYQEKAKAAAELQHNFAILAMTQEVIEAELARLADRELADNQIALAAKELCASLAITGRKKYLQTFQQLAATASDNRLRRLSQSYHDYLLKSLCGSGHCSEPARPAG